MPGQAGEPIPTVWESLEAAGIRLLKGQLGLLAAPPGCGKSALALALALGAGVNALYFSADSDDFTQSIRIISMLTGKTLAEATQLKRAGDLDEYTDRLNTPKLRFNFSAAPGLDDLQNSLQAYDEVYGNYPDLVIVDNVTNVLTGASDDDPYAGLEALMDYLHTLARGTGAAVLGLHHVTGSYNDSGKPIPLTGVKGQITRVPELVLTMYRERSDFGADRLYVSAVKNRSGKSDPSGSDFVELEFWGETMRIIDKV